MFRATTHKVGLVSTFALQNRQGHKQKQVIWDHYLLRKLSVSLEPRNRHVGTFADSSCKQSNMISNGKVPKMFKLSDYDCIGFDLDNTILRYKVTNVVKLEYEVLSKYLVEEKGYSAEYLYKPVEEDIDFIQKGLLLDFDHGNVIQIAMNGRVLQGSHGTRFMSDKEIEECYGQDRMWSVTNEFTQDMLEAWNGPVSEKIRTLLDYFDMPSSLAFARIVDSLDAEHGGKLELYKVWPDVLEGLMDMFNRDNFSLNKGGYFPALKANPGEYIHKCSENVVSWLQRIKETKTVFLVTGSNVDFASLTAEFTLGKDWKSLFDVIVCYARKPGFFTGKRPFLKLDGFKETEIVKRSELKLGGNIYSQGNWQDLYHLLANTTKLESPKCLYLGDNLIQDVYTPSEYIKCDTVAVVEELSAEGMEHHEANHLDSSVIVSEKWGSYFFNKRNNNESSIWDGIVRQYSKICIPDLEAIADLPLDHEFHCFEGKTGTTLSRPFGYYPSRPVSICNEIKT